MKLLLGGMFKSIDRHCVLFFLARVLDFEELHIPITIEV